jgi:hypothetical protein
MLFVVTTRPALCGTGQEPGNQQYKVIFLHKEFQDMMVQFYRCVHFAISAQAMICLSGELPHG